VAVRLIGSVLLSRIRVERPFNPFFRYFLRLNVYVEAIMCTEILSVIVLRTLLFLAI
jgi:hypothetical protein